MSGVDILLYIIVEFCLIFFIGALIGYVIEVLFRRFVSRKKWMNPGFLCGPWLPLYGFGLSFLYAICEYMNFTSLPVWTDTIIKLVVITIMMTLIEYIAGLIFIKGMKIKLWDYSKQWGNIQGIICPLYSFFWGVIGFAYYILIHNFINDIIEAWAQYPLSSFFVGILLGLFLCDLGMSLHLATKISNYAKEKNVVVRFEEMKSAALSFSGKFKDRVTNASEEYQHKLEELKEDLINPINVSDRFAVIGFITSFVGILLFPILLCIKGYESDKYRKLSIAGIIISFVEIIALIVLAIVLTSILR